ncbi:hypothetical protein Tco_0248931 [Tanacetum coccineum]
MGGRLFRYIKHDRMFNSGKVGKEKLVMYCLVVVEHDTEDEKDDGGGSGLFLGGDGGSLEKFGEGFEKLIWIK